MSAASSEPSAGDVLGALGEAATQLGSFVAHLIEDQPVTAVVAAATAGFIAGGGLASPLGTRITTGTLRATLGNATTLVALDLIRRALEDGERRDVGAESPVPG